MIELGSDQTKFKVLDISWTVPLSQGETLDYYDELFDLFAAIGACKHELGLCPGLGGSTNTEDTETLITITLFDDQGMFQFRDSIMRYLKDKNYLDIKEEVNWI